MSAVPRKRPNQPPMTGEQIEQLAKRVAKWIHRKGLESFNLTQVAQSHRTFGPRYCAAKDVAETLNYLQTRYMVVVKWPLHRQPRTGRRGQQPSPWYDVNLTRLAQLMVRIADQKAAG